MKDSATKMAELKFEAPLASFEEEELSNIRNMNIFPDQLLDVNLDRNLIVNNNSSKSNVTYEISQTIYDGTFSPFSRSLEDLVNTFDEKITSCFKDYETNVESLAPVQVRTQEEIMNECKMWWTITGTFGNILPVDWTKSYARKLHVPALNLNLSKKLKSFEDDLAGEDEAVAMDLDMHTLILSTQDDNFNVDEPVKTADEVLKEIDDIMQENPVSDLPAQSEPSVESNEALERSKEVLSAPHHEKKLQEYSEKQLSDFINEIDSLISSLSETLINELALRDELEYEKELKNQFISLLLAVQNRRRQHHVTEKRIQQNKTSPLAPQKSNQEYKYLTTVIPYHAGSSHLNNQALQVLIKILIAINEDSPAVPALLTDYILKVLCPT